MIGYVILKIGIRPLAGGLMKDEAANWCQATKGIIARYGYEYLPGKVYSQILYS